MIDENAKNIIYKVTNMINGKIYIGLTSRTLKERLIEHKREVFNGYKNKHLYNSIRKYGWDNFKWEIVEIVSVLVDKKENIKFLGERETYWIEFYDSNKNGYNETNGGEGVSGWTPTDEWRRKLSERMVGNSPSEETRRKLSMVHKGKILTKETRLKISKSRIGKYKGKDNPNYGNIMSDESKKRISEANKGRIFSDKVRKKMSESKKGKYTGEANPMFGKTGENNPNYGSKRSEESRKKMSKNHANVSGANNPRAKAIIQLTKDGEFIAEYPTTKDGAIACNGDNSAIVKCCKGKINYAYGFKWMYADEYYSNTEL